VFLEAGAKVQVIFLTGKLFDKFFLENFNLPFFLFLLTQSVYELVPFRVGKGNLFLCFWQIYFHKSFDLFLIRFSINT
jgi:hypothetical protein